MQGEPPCRAGDTSDQGEDPPPDGLGGHDLLAQTEPGHPQGQVVGHHLYGEPGGVGGEAARGEMVQPDAVLEISNGILDLGVSAVGRLQFEHLPVPVGDEGVIEEDRSLNPLVDRIVKLMQAPRLLSRRLTGPKTHRVQAAVSGVD